MSIRFHVALAGATLLAAAGCRSSSPSKTESSAQWCFQSRSPLSHPPEKAGATDAWLALDRDPSRQGPDSGIAGVFDDRGSFRVEWRRRTPDTLTFLISDGAPVVRGELRYDSLTFKGTVYDDRSGRSWGVSGKRQPCPASVVSGPSQWTSPAIAGSSGPDLREPATDSAGVPILTQQRGQAMGEIDSLYAVAGAVHASDLAGLWILTRHVATNKFLVGSPGLDAIWTVDSLHAAPAGAPTMRAWTLRFDGGSAGLQLIERIGGPPRVSYPDINAAGDLLFAPDFAADVAVTFHCRSLSGSKLVCVDKEHIGNGFELRRVRP